MAFLNQSSRNIMITGGIASGRGTMVEGVCGVFGMWASDLYLHQSLDIGSRSCTLLKIVIMCMCLA
jgi:hypothetical protein